MTGTQADKACCQEDGWEDHSSHIPQRLFVIKRKDCTTQNVGTTYKDYLTLKKWVSDVQTQPG